VRIVKALVVALAACTPAPQPAPIVRPVVAPIAITPDADAAPDPVLETVVVEASGVASRSEASPRILRRIVAARRGLVELTTGYTQISLMVTNVVSGTLPDPDYARRPVGANALPVILLDEAAFAAPKDMEGFGGRWKLTRLADDTLVASAIEDTPWSGDAVTGRRALITQIRRDLRSQLPAQRLAGLDALDEHLFYELVPDIIALVSDKRVDGHRRVGDFAREKLGGFVRPIVDATTPVRGRTQDDLTDWWRARTEAPVPPIPVTQTVATELARLSTSQSWPELARTPHGTVFAVSRLETPLDGTDSGAFVSGANGTRTWLSRIVPEALDVAIGPTTTGVLYAESNASWLFKVLDGGKPRSGSLSGAIEHAAFNVVEPADNGYVVFGVGPNSLLVMPLDPNGMPRMGTKKLALPAKPDAQYHRGIHPLSAARHAAGWYVAVATREGIYGVNFDKQLAATSTVKISPQSGIVEPKVAAVGERVFVAWAERNTEQLASVVVDLDGKRYANLMLIGAEVHQVSEPVVLDDGFALAWIEGDGEVHIGRWSRDGAAVSNVVVQRRDAGPSLELARDGAALVVTFLDESRYPYAAVSRRL
jgi:hypothetical protein